MASNGGANTLGPSNIGDNNNTNANNENSNSNPTRNRNTRNNQNNNLQHTDPNTFEGNIPEVSVVLGLRYEKFKKKTASFESFLEKFSVYFISNLNDGGDTKSIFRKMKSPTADFRANNKPSAPGNDADTVDMNIYKEEIKLFVSREINPRRNVQKIFGII